MHQDAFLFQPIDAHHLFFGLEMIDFTDGDLLFDDIRQYWITGHFGLIVKGEFIIG